MRREALLVLAAVALLLAPEGASAKDFPESVLEVDPLAAAARPGIPAGMGGAFEYGNYLFSHDAVDSFYLRSSLSPVVLDLNGDFALGLDYDTVLLCGPVSSGQTAANIADFWMNAVQFEYGLYLSGRIPAATDLQLIAEYSRTSQHPLNSSNTYTYSQVTADILMLGLAAPGLEAGAVALRGYLRLGYRDLFAFWRSSLPKPRVSWVCKPGIEARLPLGGNRFLVARSDPEIFIDRYKRALDANFFGEAGIAFAEGGYDDELLLTFYATRDSDLLEGVAHPTFEAGLALRLAVSRL